MAEQVQRLNNKTRENVRRSGVLSVLVTAFLAVTQLPAAQAGGSSRYRLGGSLGFGGSGVTQVATVNDQATIVERSEGPAVISLFADRLFSDYFSLGIEHTRGVNFAPFSMGSSFTGVAARWYFLGPASSVADTDGEKTLLLIKRFSPYAGGSVGAASATIERPNDLVPVIEGSGVYFGIRIGADYPLAPGIGIRPEFLYSTTIFQSATLASSLSEYSLGCGLFILL